MNPLIQLKNNSTISRHIGFSALGFYRKRKQSSRPRRGLSQLHDC